MLRSLFTKTARFAYNSYPTVMNIAKLYGKASISCMLYTTAVGIVAESIEVVYFKKNISAKRILYNFTFPFALFPISTIYYFNNHDDFYNSTK